MGAPLHWLGAKWHPPAPGAKCLLLPEADSGSPLRQQTSDQLTPRALCLLKGTYFFRIGLGPGDRQVAAWQ